MQRDLEPAAAAQDRSGDPGRSVIAVIGIDRYQGWRRLTNAVKDALGAAELFEGLGFEQVTTPLVDEAATGKAIQALVKDELRRKLGPDDSLVLFYAGHGGTQEHQLGGQLIKTGYLIPVDASESPDEVSTWIELDGWLRAVALLPAKHILVILDACHSGIALGSIIKWRDIGTWKDTAPSILQTRRSRRIITSALGDQVALDSGPKEGHSLFTGCLIEALTHGLGDGGSRVITGSELGVHLQRRVETYPHSRQTPDFGTFDFDDRGELLIRLVPVPREELPPEERRPEERRPEARPPTGDRARRRAILLGVEGATFALGLALFAYNGTDPAPPAPGLSGAPARPGAAPLGPGSCPAGMVWVSPGMFSMGSADGEGDADEHPQHQVKLSGYCIDQTEVTVAAYDACVADEACTAATRTASWGEGAPAHGKRVSRWCNGPDRPQHPMNCVDWEQAKAYCEWAGKRLPTEAEWEYAARGSDGRKYPWGDQEPSAERLNACGSECVAWAKTALNGEGEPMYGGDDGAETTAPVGGRRAGASPFGVLDLAGNVAEWTADWYRDWQDMGPIDPRGPSVGEVRVRRGGSWLDQRADQVRAADRDGDLPTNRLPMLGFRCVVGA